MQNLTDYFSQPLLHLYSFFHPFVCLFLHSFPSAVWSATEDCFIQGFIWMDNG